RRPRAGRGGRGRADALFQAAGGHRLPARAPDRGRGAGRGRPRGRRGRERLMADIVMPRLSDTMEEGTILRWLGHDGEEIRRGQELVEIETDKATMVYESDQQGTLEIVAQEGQTLAVGELIARVGVAGADGASERAPASTARVDGEGPAPGGPAGVPAGAVPPQADSGPAPVSPRADERERVQAPP